MDFGYELENKLHSVRVESCPFACAVKSEEDRRQIEDVVGVSIFWIFCIS
jgi:hypothetical protein